MMNHLTSTNFAWDNVAYVHISMFYGQILLGGGKMMGYKNFSNVQDGSMKFPLTVRNGFGSLLTITFTIFFNF